LPRGDIFSEAPILGPRSSFNFRPFLTTHRTGKWSSTTDLNVFWRMKTEGGVYPPGRQIIRAPNRSGERFVGSAITPVPAVDDVEPAQ